MKCEICHKADAATVLHRRKPDGSDEELYVCKACAAAAQTPKKSPAADKRGKGDVNVSFAGGEPPPFVADFLKAAVGLVEGIAGQEKDKKTCPGCGHSWEQIKEERRVGCPRCYRAFAELIRQEFFAGAYRSMHVGERPEGLPPGGDMRAQLERALKDAIKRQQFEKAAEIRRALDKLGGTPPSKPRSEPRT